MHYELYIDILFFTNFMMDSLLLFAVRKILKYQVPGRRVLLGGAVGAALTCLVIAVPMPGVLKGVLLYAVVSVLMVKAGLKVKAWGELPRAIGLLYISAFLMGGILQAFQPYVRAGSFYFAVAAVSYLVLGGCWKMLTRIQRLQKKICEVTLFTERGEYHIQSLVDTGNTLTDPLSKEPVHVVDVHTAKKIFGEQISGTEEGGKDGFLLRYIPYVSVGGAGVMPVTRIEKMCIQTGEEHWFTKPVIGICEEMISEKKDYQMILNPDILGGAKTWL